MRLQSLRECHRPIVRREHRGNGRLGADNERDFVVIESLPYTQRHPLAVLSKGPKEWRGSALSTSIEAWLPLRAEARGARHLLMGLSLASPVGKGLSGPGAAQEDSLSARAIQAAFRGRDGWWMKCTECRWHGLGARRVGTAVMPHA